MLELARIYASRGIAVFPCRERNDQVGKVKSPYTYKGFKAASSDPYQVANWWRCYPHALVGLPCRMNGLIVIDPDLHGAENGVFAFCELAKSHGYNLDNATYVTTPNFGWHLLYQRPRDLSATIGKIGPAIDVKDNGYVIGAGSFLADGRGYHLREGTVEALANTIVGKQLPLPPDWLINLIAKPTNTTPPRARTNFDNEVSLARLKGLIQKVALAPAGERNRILFWATCRAGEMIRDGFVQYDTAFALFVEAGLYSGLDRREVERSVQSGLLTTTGSA